MASAGPEFIDDSVPRGTVVGRANAYASFWQAFRVQARVIGALTLRDFRTRYGGSYLSYSIAVLWPFSHFAILLIVYTFVGRTPSYGTDLFAWVMSGTLPFVLFLYSTRLIAVSLSTNASLLGFSIVRRIDIVIARSLAELVTCVMITTMVFTIYIIYRGEFAFADFETCLLAALMAYLTGVAFGTVGAPIVRIAPFFVMVIYLLCVICWLTAGIVYLPDSVPDPYHWYFALNPLVHCSELFRTGLYNDYQSNTLNTDYLLTLDACLILAGLIMDRVLPRLATWVR